MDRTTFEYYRRTLQLRKSRVADILPSYFSEYYPNIVSFLENYYEALDVEGEITETFEYDLFAIRDLDEVSLKYIDRIFYEIANGASSKYFSDPRLIGKLIPLLIQNKGNVFSVELFFRIFFNETPEVQYPKNNILFVFSGNNDKINEAIIGVDSLRYLQNGRKYQILSILIRSGINFDRWADLYKKFVHPTGFYLSSEIATETTANFGITFMPDAGGAAPPVITFQEISTGTLFTPSVSEITLEADSANTVLISSINETPLKYGTFTIQQLDSAYGNVGQLVGVETLRFDDSDLNLYDSNGVALGGSRRVMDISRTLETFDQSITLVSYSLDSV